MKETQTDLSTPTPTILGGDLEIGNSVAKPVLTSLKEARAKLTLVVANCGIKHLMAMKGDAKGEPDQYLIPKADLYLDCRGVANPAHGGPGGSGDDIEVQNWVGKHSAQDLIAFGDQIYANIQRLTTRKGAGKEYDKPFRIMCMCAHGIHRSRSVKHILARQFKAGGWNVEVE